MPAEVAGIYKPYKGTGRTQAAGNRSNGGRFQSRARGFGMGTAGFAEIGIIVDDREHDTVTTTIDVICPVYREEEAIALFHERLTNAVARLRDRYVVRVLYVVDPSGDGTETGPCTPSAPVIPSVKVHRHVATLRSSGRSDCRYR